MRGGRWVLVGVGVALLVVAGFLFEASLGALASDWAYEMTGIRDAQGRGLSGAGVTVAVIDTGFDPSHPSLKGIRLVAWKDYVNNRAEAYDDAGHGSHVVGVLAGSGASFSGRLQGANMKGAAPGIGLVAVKAIGAGGQGTSSAVADGVDFAVQRNADIICLSLGSQPSLVAIGDELANAIDGAINRGILVVAAAGNTGEDTGRNDVENPAGLEGVIAVGAVDQSKRPASFTAVGNADKNYGYPGPGGHRTGLLARPDPHKKPELAAPGVKIQSAWSGGEYRLASGTSQAAPFACGALALLLEAEPQLKAENGRGLIDRVKAGLKDSSQPVPGQQTPHDPRTGYGLLRADRLLDRF